MAFKYFAAAGASVLMIAGCGPRDGEPQQSADTQAVAEPAATELPATITLSAAGFLPEGVEYDANNHRFLVGSLAQGTVFAVAEDGSLTPFAEDAELKSSVGIEIDEERNRLLVANADSAAFGSQSPGQAKLGIYALDSGERIAMIDLASAGPEDAPARFSNDVAVGTDGSAYVTDTMARVVYAVAPDNAVSVLAPQNLDKDQRLAFNGIEFHPAGYLLVAEMMGGDLYKVALDEPENFVRVELEEQVPGADGIVLHPDGTLYVVRNDQSLSVVALRSEDDWATASVAGKATFEMQATTATLVGDDVYVVHPYFNDPQAMPFIERVAVE